MIFLIMYSIHNCEEVKMLMMITTRVVVRFHEDVAKR